MTLLTYSSHLIVEPLLFGIQNNLIDHPFRLQCIPERNILQSIDDDEVDFVVISPMIYAQACHKLKIVKKIVISSSEAGRNILMYFKKDLPEIARIFYDKISGDIFERFFGKVILAELFDVDAEWTACELYSDVNENLKYYPVFLVTSDNAYEFDHKYAGMIDLTEEWINKNQLPFVQRLVCVKSGFKDHGEVNVLESALAVGQENLKQICITHASEKNKSVDFYLNLLTVYYSYFDSELIWKSLKESLNYFFYYGQCEYYPELRFY